MSAKIERKFSKWFEAQFGKQPVPGVTSERLRVEYIQAINREVLARSRFEARKAWDLRRDAAYKAWLAKEAADEAS